MANQTQYPRTDIGGLEDFVQSSIDRKAIYPSTDIGGLEDLVQSSIESIAFPSGGVDGDGRTMVYNTDIRYVQYYDATQDPWHIHGPGFSGVGRDGIRYYNGVPCGPGTLGTLAGGINYLSWCIGNAPPLDHAHIPGRTSWTVISDGCVRMVLTNGSNWESIGIRSHYKWCFTGDFDVQVMFTNVLPNSGPSDGGAWLGAIMDPDNYCYCRRRVGNYYDKDVRYGGSWKGYQSGGTCPNPGGLRTVRSGGNISNYGWNGSSWVQIGSTVGGFPSGPMFINMDIGGTGGTYTYQVDFFNFQINSGTTSNLAGWAREPAGTHRGSRADFPMRALLVCTASTIDILDLDNSKLWMRFLRGSGNAFHTYNGTEYPRQVVIRDGSMLVAYGTPTTSTDEGGGIWIDFNLDTILIARMAASPITGGILQHKNLVSWQGTPREFMGYGSIQCRNAGKGYYYDNNQFAIPAYRTLSVDLQHAGGYQYRAFGTSGGLTLQRWMRWHMEVNAATGQHFAGPLFGNASGVNTAIYWVWFDPSDLTVYFMTASGFYFATRAVWEASLTNTGGSFAPTYIGPVPGSRSYEWQYIAVKRGAGFYTPSNAGVYWTALSSGSSTLMYGKAGSGASYEILPDYDRVTTLAYAADGDKNLLLIAYEKWNRSGIIIVNLDLNSIYGMAPTRLSMSMARSITT